MTPEIRLRYQLHAKTGSYRAKLAQATDVIERGLSCVARPYVACSFGKDSSVMLHLIMAVKPDVPVRFIRWRNETEIIDDYDAVLEWWRERNVNLEMIEMQRTSFDESVPDRWRTDGYDSYFIGFRADESRGRRMTLRVHGVIYKNSAGMTRIAPLAWWSEGDVGAYIVENVLPLLSSYGGDLSNRTSARVPREAFGIRDAMLRKLKYRDPAAFNELAARFPEVKEYV